MKTKIRVVEHLPFEERERRYRKAKDGLARGHWQVIWLIAQGTPAQHVAEMTSYSYTWVRTLVQRYNQDGPEALSDGRHANAGGQYILSVLQQQQLQEALEHNPSDGGLWSGPKVACWIAEQTGRQVHPQLGWEYLHRLHFRKRVLRPRHVNADPQAQDVEQIQTEHPEATVELWAMDEHHIGLKPLLRRIWVRKGSRPGLSVQQRFEWMYLYGFVHPHSGRTEWLILPTVDIETMNLALAHFAHAVGANAQKHIALVMDQAGWHASSHVQIPEGLASALFATILSGITAK